ncbi:MAG: glycosyltransferase, partial [Actinobacteria bacterium]
GGALQSGFAQATRDWVFYTDGDGQYHAGELEQLLDQVDDDVDVVQGYKLSRADNLVRRIIGRVYHRCVARLFGLQIRDTDCDFRLIRRAKLDQITLEETSGVICVELVRKLQDVNAQFVEVGVHHYPRLSGRSRFFTPRNIATPTRCLRGHLASADADSHGSSSEHRKSRRGVDVVCDHIRDVDARNGKSR